MSEIIVPTALSMHTYIGVYTITGLVDSVFFLSLEICIDSLYWNVDYVVLTTPS